MSSDTGRFALLDLRRSPIFRFLGNLGWPILQKEIRSDFRKDRFFITHLVCLSVLAAGILWQVSVTSEGSLRAEEIGRGLFNTFFIIQFLVVTVVFPAFSASTISEERALETFDLLVTTDLRPNEIVWGKFLASSIYCLIYIVATIPLLAVSLLFAGVGLWEIGVAYMILIGITVFLTMTGTFISGCFRSTVRATIVMYFLSFSILAYAAYQWWTIDARGGTLIRALIERHLPSAVRSDPVLGLLATAWFAWIFAVPFAFLFVLAANRLRPRTDDRTSKLRILVVLTFLPTLYLAHERGMRFGTLVVLSGLVLFLAGLVFASEDPYLPPRLRRLFAGRSLPRRIFIPGSRWGLVYMTLLDVAVTGILGWILVSSRPTGLADPFKWDECLATLPIYLFAYQALGFFLSAGGFTPSYTALTVAFIAIITTLLPVIFQIGGRPDGIFSFYYLSPYTIWTSLDSELLRDPQGPRYVLFGYPIVRVAQILFGTAGIVFLILGARRFSGRRRKKEGKGRQSTVDSRQYRRTEGGVGSRQSTVDGTHGRMGGSTADNANGRTAHPD